jgi:hypothetical protein
MMPMGLATFVLPAVEQSERPDGTLVIASTEPLKAHSPSIVHDVRAGTDTHPTGGRRQGGGSSPRVERVLVLSEPPELDAGETHQYARPLRIVGVGPWPWLCRRALGPSTDGVTDG